MSPVFFIDRALGAHIFPDALAAAGVHVERHRDHFAHNAPDEEWIPEVARRDWYALSNDGRIYRNPPEREAVMNSGLGFFIVRGGSDTSAALAENFVSTYGKVLAFIERHDRPFIATISRAGGGKPGRVELRYPRSQ